MPRATVSGRQTAVLGVSYPGPDPDALLALDVERRYDVSLTIDGHRLPAQRFASPLGDESWREVIQAIRYCATERDAPLRGNESAVDAARRRNRRRAEDVRAAGRQLFRVVRELNPALRTFLESTTPRRLVIESDRPEIHALPWEALTDESWHSAASQDLSIVHCNEAFHVVPRSSPGVLQVWAIAGPGVRDDTIAALRSVVLTNDAGRLVGIKISEADNPVAHLVHLLAHGDKSTGITDLGFLGLKAPSQLAQQLKDRLMVALWSCFSAMARAWEPSPAQALHKSGNTFVLGFSAPLHFEASAVIARRFYDDVFGPSGHQDPEAAVTAIRAALFDNCFEFCDWASLTVWLQRPVELTALPLGRMRVPHGDWVDRAIGPEDDQLRHLLQKEAALGDVRVLRSTHVTLPLPREIARDWGGPVVHLHGKSGLAAGVYKTLGIDVDRCVHDADRFRALLDHLASYRYALILWTDVTANEVLLVQTLHSVPVNVGIVLVSSYALTPGWPGRGMSGDDGGAAEALPAETSERFLYLVGRDRFAEALKLQEVKDGDAEYWSGRYFAYIKAGNEDGAGHCIARLRELGEAIEADLLQANLLSRQDARLKARELYLKTADIALRDKKLRELGRVRQELAYVAGEMGDRGLAVQLFESAIELLETTDERGPRWTSALARALRDYADLLAREGRLEALAMVDRAAGIHALDGRITQVAYCRVTRSRLLCRLGRLDEADTAAHEAAIVFDRARNLDGWADAVRLIASIATERNRHAQALAVLRTAVTERQGAGERLKAGLIGKILLQMAEVTWALGRVDEAAAHARRAEQLLRDYPPEFRQARRLIDVIGSLAAATPRAAAVAGRMLNEEEPSTADWDRIRVALAQAFIDHRVETVVCSAARGADLLALDVARRLGIGRQIVLPYSRDRFRATSVTPPGSKDPGRWGRLYDDLLVPNDRVTVQELKGGSKGYDAVTTRILELVGRSTAGGRPLAIVVWDGKRRAGRDRTADFKEGTQFSFETVEILT